MLSKHEQSQKGGEHSTNYQAHGDINIIHNIVVLSNFLSSVQIEGILPTQPDTNFIQTISEAIEQKFQERLGDDITYATAVASDILSATLQTFTLNKQFEALRFRTLLRSLANDIVPKLKEYHYWETFHDPIDNVIVSSTKYRGEVIFLTALTELWKKQVNQEISGFAIGRLISIGGKPVNIFIIKDSKYELWEAAYAPDRAHELDRNSFFGMLTRHQYRVFIIGIILDLIRLGTEAATDRRFWNNIVNLLSPDSR